VVNSDRPTLKVGKHPKKWTRLQNLEGPIRIEVESGDIEMKNRMRLVTAIAFCLLAAVRIAEAQTVYELEGTVYGPDSKAMANVTVTLQNHAGAQIDQDITKNDGRYRFAGVLAGTYYLAVKPAESGLQQLLQKIELINTGVNVSNYSKERFDFSLRRTTAERPPVVGTVFAQAVPPEAEKEYLSAVSSISKGEREAATAKLNRAIEIFPTYFAALQQLGFVYIDSEKDQLAIEPLTKSLQVNSRSAHSHLGLGIAYVNLNQPKEAIKELKEALALDRSDFRSHLYLGMALIDTGKLDEAEKSLKESYTIGGPTQARTAHLYLASIYSTRKEYQKAIDELETYLRENPKAPNAPKIREAIAKMKAKV
jgi:tetratricopeptide (TPR) repeat protein